jgi:MFS family permease
MNPTSIAAPDAAARRRSIAFLNWAHAVDHFVLLIYPTVVLGLIAVFGRSYSELIALSSAAFIAFGVFSLPAGWLADRWSRRNMMGAFYIGCGVSLIVVGISPNLIVLAAGMFALGVFAAIYHPVGMAMLIEASQARGRTLAFNGVCGNLGVSLAAGISAFLASWINWRAAFIVPGVLVAVSGLLYVWLTPDDRHHAKTRKSVPTVPLTPRMAIVLFSLFLAISVTAGVTFNMLTIALPKIVDERLATHVPLVLAGSIATAVLICGGIAQLFIGRLSERFAPHSLFVAVTGIGFLGNLGAAYFEGVPLMIMLAISVAAIYAQVTINDMVLARYTADAWRGRVYAVRYFTLFISAACAIAMISVFHERGGFGLVLGVNAIVAFAMFLATVGLTVLIGQIEARHAQLQAAE